jgi:hypothetical protein
MLVNEGSVAWLRGTCRHCELIGPIAAAFMRAQWIRMKKNIGSDLGSRLGGPLGLEVDFGASTWAAQLEAWLL